MNTISCLWVENHKALNKFHASCIFETGFVLILPNVKPSLASYFIFTSIWQKSSEPGWEGHSKSARGPLAAYGLDSTALVYQSQFKIFSQSGLQHLTEYMLVSISIEMISRYLICALLTVSLHISTGPQYDKRMNYLTT